MLSKNAFYIDLLKWSTLDRVTSRGRVPSIVAASSLGIRVLGRGVGLLFGCILFAWRGKKSTMVSAVITVLLINFVYPYYNQWQPAAGDEGSLKQKPCLSHSNSIKFTATVNLRFWERVDVYLNYDSVGFIMHIYLHLWRKSAIYISALYVLRYGLVCSVAPRKNFGTLTTAPKFQHHGSAETSNAMDGFFPVRTCMPHALTGKNTWFHEEL